MPGLLPTWLQPSGFFVILSVVPRTAFSIGDLSDPRTTKFVHKRLYNEMLCHDRDHVESHLAQRFAAKGLNWDSIRDSLRRVPSSVPQTHRCILMRFLLNGLPTTRRMRFVSNVSISACPFCAAAGCDDVAHWFSCPALNFCYTSAVGATSDLEFQPNVFQLQQNLQGRDIQLISAVLHAVWRCRSVLMRRLSFSSLPDMAQHFKSLIEDPWIRGAPLQLTRAERRAVRSHPPDMPQGWFIYFSDGASRSGDAERQASFGVVLKINGEIIARLGVYLGDETNNEADLVPRRIARINAHSEHAST